MVAWIEKADGTFVTTLYITAKTGLYGLGNRPGRFDFNSGPIPDASRGVDDMWPYGRRVNTFPVWVWGTIRNNLPPQVHVIGTAFFAIAVTFVALSTAFSARGQRNAPATR